MQKFSSQILIHALFFLPSAGSDVVSMKYKADRVDGGYVLNGNKMWCTNGPVAETLVLWWKVLFHRPCHCVDGLMLI